MRKVLAVALVALASLLLMAAPALALRDPFDPVITSDSESSTTGSSETSSTVDVPTLTTDENPFTDGVPTTGVDASSWLVVSYLLVVFGAAAIVLARTLRPAPSRRH
jgi:ABC-type Na+ efflux pump permease subunit